MRKSISVIMLISSLSLTAMAYANEEHEGKWRHGDSVEWMTKELNLTADQKAKLEQISNELKEKFKALHEEKQKQIEGVLTKDQLAKYQELKKQHQELKKQRWEKWHTQHDQQSNQPAPVK